MSLTLVINSKMIIFIKTPMDDFTLQYNGHESIVILH